MADKQCPACFNRISGGSAECNCGFIFFKWINGVIVHTTNAPGRRYCPNCHGWVKWRIPKCGCGHEFSIVNEACPIKREMLRIDIDPEIVERAKTKSGKQFRYTLHEAVEEFLPVIDKMLEQTGFTQNIIKTGRIWPVGLTTIADLDEVAEKRGVSRTQLIRAVLTLFGR